MNERIKELADQAGIVLWQSHLGSITHYEGRIETLEKFAELIVRECMLCCERVISDPVPVSVDTWLNGGEQCIVEIKHHFGVE